MESVAQSESASSDKEPLESERHTGCHCIIAFKPGSGEAHLFHVWEGAHNGLSPAQRENAEAFCATCEPIVAVRIYNFSPGKSLLNDDPECSAKAQLEEMGFQFDKDITINTPESWRVVFDPPTRRILITTDRDKETPLHQETLFETPLPSASPSQVIPPSGEKNPGKT